MNVWQSLPGFRSPHIAVVIRLILLVVILSPSGSTALAQPAGDDVVPQFPNEVAYDLALMALAPDDFPVEGLVWVGGTLTGPENQAAGDAETFDLEPDAMLDALRAMGWRAMYTGDVAIPLAEDFRLWDVSGASYIIEFDDQDGAADWFDMVEGQRNEAGAEFIDAPAVGDASVLTRSESGNPSAADRPETLDLMFRTNQFVAGVALTWLSGSTVDVATGDEMAASAETLLGRIEQVAEAGGTGLFGKMLRIEPGNEAIIASQLDFYTYADGEMRPTMGDTPESEESVLALWEEGGVAQVYRRDTWFLSERADADVVGTLMVVRLYDLESRRGARSFVEIAYEDFLENWEVYGYADVEPLETLPDVDGTIAGVAYTYAYDDEMIGSGYRFWISVDEVVVAIEADNADGIDRAVVEDLLAMQVDCLERERYCQPIEMPDGLLD